MAKAHFIPADDSGKCQWLSNFAQKLPAYAPTLGVTAAEVASVQADNAYFTYVCDALNQYKQKTQEWTSYKNALRNGNAVGPMPAPPTLAAPPPAVPANIFGRAANLAVRIKRHPSYADAIGQDLG